MTEEKKIKLSNRIYPFFSGLTMDLLFWAAINTLFLTTIKGITASQINSLVSICLIFTILFQPVAIKIIKKIGNISSVRLGVFLLLCGSFLLTISKTYLFLLMGEILYETSFLFKNMDSVILRKNLKQERKTEEFIRYQSKASMIYSVTTMLIAFCAGFLFKINPYLPMICCTCFCVINFILSYLIYECKGEEEEKVEEKKSNKFSISTLLLFIYFFFGIGYSIIDIGQTNAKLLMQENMGSFLEVGTTAIYLTTIIAISRIVRVFSNLIFPHIISKWKEKVMYFVTTFLILAYFLIISGHFIGRGMVGISFIALGFFVFLFIRDSLYNYSTKLVLDSCQGKDHAKAISYLTLSNKIGKFIISMLISLLLLKLHLIYAICFMFILSIIDFILVNKIYRLIKENK